MDDQERVVTQVQKEATAIVVMRCMLEGFSSENKISFEDSMLDFAKSHTYQSLFDFSTNVWKEGPDYLRGLYDEEINGNSASYGEWSPS